MQILESYFKQTSYIQSQIEKLDPADIHRSNLEELFISEKAGLISLLNKKRSNTDVEQGFLNVKGAPFSHHNSLAKLKFPKFAEKYSEFSQFISSFNTGP